MSLFSVTRGQESKDLEMTVFPTNAVPVVAVQVVKKISSLLLCTECKIALRDLPTRAVVPISGKCPSAVTVICTCCQTAMPSQYTSDMRNSGWHAVKVYA